MKVDRRGGCLDHFSKFVKRFMNTKLHLFLIDPEIDFTACILYQTYKALSGLYKGPAGYLHTL